MVERAEFLPEKKVNEITRGTEADHKRHKVVYADDYRASRLQRGHHYAGRHFRERGESLDHGVKAGSGLYFAGEVLDLDAVTGGFNLQIAWSTAWTAGSEAAAEDWKGLTEEQNGP